MAEPAATAETTASPDGTPRPILRLRARRRRRRPAAPGLLPGVAPDAANPTEGAEASPSEADPAVVGLPRPLPPRQRSFHAPRRQRRHAPLAGVPGASDAAAEGGADATPAAPGAEPGNRPARRRNRRRRPATGDPAQNAGPREPREASAPSSRGPRHGGERRRADGEAGGADRPNPRSGDRRDARPGGERAGRRQGGRDGGRRDGPPRQIERKLYSVDSVVDRGFDDVEEEAGSRRVHWTIVKRTTADQVSRKALSAVYVLQRDGDDSEFPSLGAARNAVNKTIVHPEKLTRSKAEYAAEKGGKK
jgi:hypothetical protein